MRSAATHSLSIAALAALWWAGPAAQAGPKRAVAWNPSLRDASPYLRALPARPAPRRVRTPARKLSPKRVDLLKRIQAQRDVDLTWLELGGKAEWAKANGRLSILRLRDNYPFDEYDLFGLNYDAAAWFRHDDKLTPRARAAILTRYRHACRPQKRVWAHYWRPRDPWQRGCGPGNWYYAEIGILGAGARLLDDETQTQRALAKLAPCIADMNANGILAEYNSPTYTSHTLTGLAVAQEYTDSEELRLKCELLEERIRLDIAARLHWPSYQVGGPYSRAYSGDQTGCNSLGKIFFQFFDDVDLYMNDVTHGSPYDHTQISIPLMAVLGNNCPDYVLNIARHKSYPYTVESRVAMYERPMRMERYGDTYTHLTEEYVMGSTSVGRGFGQSSDFMLHWRRRSPVKTRHDFNLLYTRYMTNDHLPPGPSYPREEGWFHCFQHTDTAIVLYQPAWPMCTKTYSMRADVQFPALTGLPKKVYVNSQPVASYPAEVKRSDVVYLEDGDTFVAIRFLDANSLGPCPDHVVLRHMNRHLIVSSFNLDAKPGQARRFTEQDLAGAHNGFVIHAGNRHTYKTIDAFRQYIRTGRLTQKWHGPHGEIAYTIGGHTMACTYNGLASMLVSRRLDGVPVQRALFACPDARHDTSGRIAVRDAMLQTYPGEGAWLVVDRKSKQYVAAHPQNKPIYFRLLTPDCDIETRAFPLGKIVYRRGKTPTVDIRCVERPGHIRIRPQHMKVRVLLNGHDITDETVPADTYMHNVPRKSRVTRPAHVVFDCKARRWVNRGADVQVRHVRFAKVLEWELVNRAWRENRVGIKIKNFPTRKANVAVGTATYRNEVLYEQPCGFTVVLPDPRPANELLVWCREMQRRCASAGMAIRALHETPFGAKRLIKRELGIYTGDLKRAVERLERSRSFVCYACPLPTPAGVRLTPVGQVLSAPELRALSDRMHARRALALREIHRIGGGTALADNALAALVPLDLHVWATRGPKGMLQLHTKAANERYNPVLNGRFAVTLPQRWRLGRPLQRADHNQSQFTGLAPAGRWKRLGWELLALAGAGVRPERITVAVHSVCEGVPITHRVALQAGRPALRTWQLIGPFANPEDAGLGRVYPPEQKLDLNASHPGVAGPVRWRVHRSYTNAVDLLNALGPNENAVAYGVCWVHSPVARAARLEVGSDDGIRVWVNGKAVLSVDRGRPLWAGEDVAPLDLHAGWNQVLVKVTQKSGGWAFLVELYDQDRNPLTDLRFETRRPKK